MIDNLILETSPRGRAYSFALDCRSLGEWTGTSSLASRFEIARVPFLRGLLLSKRRYHGITKHWSIVIQETPLQIASAHWLACSTFKRKENTMMPELHQNSERSLSSTVV